MPRKNTTSTKAGNTKGTSKSGSVTYRGFYNRKPTSEEHKQYEQMLENGTDFSSILDEIIVSGFKLSTSFIRDGDHFIASLYCTDATNADAGYGISARAYEREEAYRRVTFLYFYVLDQSIASHMETTYSDEW